MKKVLLAALLVACVVMCGCEATTDTAKRSERGRFEAGESWQGSHGATFGTVVDKETGVVYLTWRSGWQRSSVGGITPLLDSDGNVVIDRARGDEQ